MATVVSQICVPLSGRPELSWGNFVAGHQSGLRGRGTPHWQYVLAHLALLATIKKRSETRNRIHENALLQISPLRTSSLILTSSGHSWDVQSASESSTLTPICFQGNQFSKTKFELVSIQRKLPCIPRRRCADDLVKHYSTTIRLSRCNSHHLTCNPPWCAQISRPYNFIRRLCDRFYYSCHCSFGQSDVAGGVESPPDCFKGEKCLMALALTTVTRAKIFLTTSQHVLATRSSSHLT